MRMAGMNMSGVRMSGMRMSGMRMTGVRLTRVGDALFGEIGRERHDRSLPAGPIRAPRPLGNRGT